MRDERKSATKQSDSEIQILQHHPTRSPSPCTSRRACNQMNKPDLSASPQFRLKVERTASAVLRNVHNETVCSR